MIRWNVFDGCPKSPESPRFLDEFNEAVARRAQKAAENEKIRALAIRAQKEHE